MALISFALRDPLVREPDLPEFGSALPPFTVEANPTIEREPVNDDALLTAVWGSMTTLGRGATKTKGSVRQLPLLPPILSMLGRRTPALGGRRRYWFTAAHLPN